MISIREETPKDYAQVLKVTSDAFAHSEFGHHGEAALIDTLRSNCDDRLSLVAHVEDKIVGHVLFTPTVVRTGQSESRGMGLAPMSVAPEHQKAGIGSSLVRDGLNRLFNNGCPFVVVLGHPEYYPRFGFRPAAEFGVSHGFSGIPQDVFFIRDHPSGDSTPIASGAAYYRPEFGPQHEER